MGRILALAWLLELVSAPLVMAAAVFYDIQQKVPALVFTLLALGVLAAKAAGPSARTTR